MSEAIENKNQSSARPALRVIQGKGFVLWQCPICRKGFDTNEERQACTRNHTVEEWIKHGSPELYPLVTGIEEA